VLSDHAFESTHLALSKEGGAIRERFGIVEEIDVGPLHEMSQTPLALEQRHDAEIVAVKRMLLLKLVGETMCACGCCHASIDEGMVTVEFALNTQYTTR